MQMIDANECVFVGGLPYSLTDSPFFITHRSSLLQMIDANERVFVGGLPYYLTEDQCRELLGSFGAIKSFDLVKDRETGNSKG